MKDKLPSTRHGHKGAKLLKLSNKHCSDKTCFVIKKSYKYIIELQAKMAKLPYILQHWMRGDLTIHKTIFFWKKGYYKKT